MSKPRTLIRFVGCIHRYWALVDTTMSKKQIRADGKYWAAMRAMRRAGFSEEDIARVEGRVDRQYKERIIEWHKRQFPDSDLAT